jgi:hypothetical protein
MKFRSEHYWLLLFAFCFIAYQQIQDNIRPKYIGVNSTIKYLLGVAPNFFPAIGIPALFVVLIPQFLKKSNPNSWVLKNRHLAANLISLAGLIVWEFLQLTGKLRFDWNDIRWTLIGAFIFSIIWMISPKQYKKS